MFDMLSRLFIDALWSSAGKGLISWLSFVMSNCEFVTFPLVSWVRCWTWVYRFLIFLTLFYIPPIVCGLCFVLHYFVSFLGREGWLWFFCFCFNQCLSDALLLFMLCGSSSRYRAFAWQCVIVVFPDHFHLLFGTDTFTGFFSTNIAQFAACFEIRRNMTRLIKWC